MEKKKQETILTLIFVGILIMLSLNSSLIFSRIDITQNKIYTISQVSRNIFKEIQEKVYLTYYVTDKLKAVNPVYRQIEDILREYSLASGDKVVFTTVDPVRDKKTYEAQEYGIMNFESGTQDSPDQANIFVAYSGIVLQYMDRFRVLPLVQAVDTLEYDLSTNLRQLLTNKTKKIAFLLDKGDLDQSSFYSLTNWMKQYFDVEMLEKGQDISPEITCLVIVGGTNLTEFDLYPVDQYLMNGGRLFFMVDAIMLNFQYGFAMPTPSAPVLELLKSYGVTVEPALVMENNRLSIPAGRPYNYFFSSYQDFVAKDNPITARFKTVYFFAANPISLAPPPGVSAEKLVNTSPYAVKISQNIPVDPKQVAATYALASGSAETQTVAVVLAGNFPSFFKDKTIPQKEGEKRDWSYTRPQSEATRVLVVSDSDLISPDYLAYTSYINLNFFINCIEWLSNEEDLLAIRTRGQRDLFMGKIQKEDERTAVSNFIIVLNLVGVPLLVVGAGLLNYFLRRRRRKAA